MAVLKVSIGRENRRCPGPKQKPPLGIAAIDVQRTPDEVLLVLPNVPRQVLPLKSSSMRFRFGGIFHFLALNCLSSLNVLGILAILGHSRQSQGGYKK